MKPIKFGTDGWRGVIADDFTFQRVAVVCAAIGEYLQAEGMAKHGVAIGYDNRFASEQFAQLAAVMLTQQGIRVYLSDRSLPTPMFSFAIRHRKLGGGIMVTASHNPAQYNGIKFKPWYAGSASEDSTIAIEERANRLLDTLDVDAVRGKGLVESLCPREDFFPPYAEHALNYVTVEPIRDMHPALVVRSALWLVPGRAGSRAAKCRLRRQDDSRRAQPRLRRPEPGAGAGAVARSDRRGAPHTR